MAEVKALHLDAAGETKEHDGASDELAGVINSTAFKRAVQITQTAYDALDPPDADTLYFIEE